MRPRQVLLFSGHRMDTPQRRQARFPPALETAAADAIAGVLVRLDADAADLALCQAAAGGDLLFLEACARRGVPRRVLLPCEEQRFVAHSVVNSLHGEAWLLRWLALKPGLATPPGVLPDEPAGAATGRDIYERCNEWLLQTASAWGVERLRVICLWDGAVGDGAGGTADLVKRARQRGAQIDWIDLRRLA